MGKYKWGEDSIGTSKIDVMYCIANELAEANRLKRVEIQFHNMGLTSKSFQDLCEQLEDKA